MVKPQKRYGALAAIEITDSYLSPDTK